MEALLNRWIPHVMEKLPELFKCTWQTLYMMGVSGIISLALGLAVGVVLIAVRHGGGCQTLLFTVFWIKLSICSDPFLSLFYWQP